MREVALEPASLERFRTVLDDAQWARLEDAAARARRQFAGRVVWNVNSTGRGGGVAELLGALVPYSRAAGVDVRWVVIDGDPAFFRVTKRLHNMLHGFPGDGEGLSPGDAENYRAAAEHNARELTAVIRRGHLVLLHDPQTAGLVGAAATSRCAGRVALPRRRGLPERQRQARLVLLATARLRRREARLLEGGIRLGGPRPRACRGDPAVDRRVHAEEPATAAARRRVHPPGRRHPCRAVQRIRRLHPARRNSWPRRAGCRAKRLPSAPRQRPRRRPGVALGPTQGSRGRAARFRGRNRAVDGRPPRAGGS